MSKKNNVTTNTTTSAAATAAETKRASVALKTFSLDTQGEVNERQGLLVIDASNVKDTDTFGRRVLHHWCRAHIEKITGGKDYKNARDMVEEISIIPADARTEEQSVTLAAAEKTLASLKKLVKSYQDFAPDYSADPEERERAAADKYAMLWAIAAGAPVKLEWGGMDQMLSALESFRTASITEEGAESGNQNALRKQLREEYNLLLWRNFMTGENSVYKRSRLNANMEDVMHLITASGRADKLDAKDGLMKKSAIKKADIQKVVINRAVLKLQSKLDMVWTFEDLQENSQEIQQENQNTPAPAMENPGFQPPQA